MQKISNRKCIRNLSRKSLRANRGRNVIAVLAIVLTTVLFTSLFTIAGTIVNSFQQSNFRMAGGNDHGTFKDITWEQVEELKDDPLIVSYGLRQVLGMPADPPFHKAHVEVSYGDENYATSSFCVPEQGRLPAEGSDEIACDTRILKLLGVEPKLGAKVTLTYDLGYNRPVKTPITGTFTLCGWWTYDPVAVASHALLPRSYAEALLAKYPPLGEDDMTGRWTLDVNFKSANNIEENLNTILENHGYQSQGMQEEGYIGIGVNWGYVGAQMSSNFDPATMLAAGGLLLLIVFTGYLIIYNIFQISVTNDIRFYGLLKTIGTTPRQIRRIIRMQALLLSALGIPLGLLVGYGVGNLLAPAVMSTLSYTSTHATANPLIFIGAAAFSLVTVLLSTNKPGRVAGRVSPVEAVRYTEGGGKRAQKRGNRGGKVASMALANLGRSRKKTVLVVLSLALAVVLLQVTYLFAGGFDMDKYLEQFVVTDFILGDANYFQTGGSGFSADEAVDEDTIAAVHAQGEITDSARIYGATTQIDEFVTEDYYRQRYGEWNSPEVLEHVLANKEHTAEGKVPDNAQLYGMEPYALDQLKVLEGELSALRDPSQNAIAAVYLDDDYGKPHMDSNWAKLGDKVTLRYVDEREYYDTRTGEAGDPEQIPSAHLDLRVLKSHEVEYTVVALVIIRSSMSYRYYGSDEFVLGDETFLRDTGTDSIMTYLFDTTDETNTAMDTFLKDYTENVDPVLDFESSQSYEEEFYEFRNMFLLMGGALSGIIALVGILNFFNAMLTSILARRREFAVLQSVGMTGRQLKAMLVWEGVYYAIFSLLLSLALALVGGPAMGKVMGNVFWFFTYRFSLLPVLVVTPVFLLLGIVLPLLLYRLFSRQSIVERLREAE